MDEITAKDGLLWRNGKYIELPEADSVAREYGLEPDVPFQYAEQLVEVLANGVKVFHVKKRETSDSLRES